MHLTNLAMEIVTIPEYDNKSEFEFDYENEDGLLIEEVVIDDQEEEEATEFSFTDLEEDAEQEDDVEQEEDIEQDDNDDEDEFAELEDELVDILEDPKPEEQVAKVKRLKKVEKVKKGEKVKNEEKSHTRDRQVKICANDRSRLLGCRYLLFDGLVAKIVDFNDNLPVVEFSAATYLDLQQLPLECGLCYVVTPKSRALLHRRTHLMPDTNTYQCIYCDESHANYYQLAGHAREHMSLAPYVCEPCKLYFTTKSDCRSHNKMHNYQRSKCLLCPKQFNSKAVLSMHVRNMHQQEAEQPTAPASKKYKSSQDCGGTRESRVEPALKRHRQQQEQQRKQELQKQPPKQQQLKSQLKQEPSKQEEKKPAQKIQAHRKPGPRLTKTENYLKQQEQKKLRQTFLKQPTVRIMRTTARPCHSKFLI